MIDIKAMIRKEIENGYSEANAQSKVSQDLLLKAISMSVVSRNVTIKGGVVMRSKTKNIRRATKDLDLDFIRYSLSDEAIDRFLVLINCLDGLSIERIGKIKELKQHDYHGKRLFVKISDQKGFLSKTSWILEFIIDLILIRKNTVLILLLMKQAPVY